MKRRSLFIIIIIVSIIAYFPSSTIANDYKPIKDQIELGGNFISKDLPFRISLNRINRKSGFRYRLTYEWDNSITVIPEDEITKIKTYKTNNLVMGIGQTMFNWKDRIIGYGLLGAGINISNDNSFTNLRATIGAEVNLYENISLYAEKLFQGEQAAGKINDYNDIWFGIKVSFPNYYYYEKLANKHPNWPFKIIKLVVEGAIKESLYQEHSNWDIEILKAISNNKLLAGMTTEQVLTSWGAPDSKYNFNNQEIWSYKSLKSGYVMDESNYDSSNQNSRDNELYSGITNQTWKVSYQGTQLRFSEDGILLNWSK